MNSIVSAVREVTENGSVGTWVNLGTQHWRQRITGDRTSLISGKGEVNSADYPVIIITVIGGQSDTLTEMYLGQSKESSFGRIQYNRQGYPQVFIGIADSLAISGVFNTYQSNNSSVYTLANNPWDICHYADFNQIASFDITVYGLKL